MTVAVTVAGQAAQSVPYQSAQPPAAWKSLQVPVSNTAGNWLIAVVTWRQQAASEGATVHVGDDTMRNFWQPLGQPTGTSSASGVVRCAIWTAPAAYAAQYVLVAPTATVQGIACTVLTVSGMLPWQTLTSLTTAWANTATALTALTAGAPASQALLLTACGSDNDTDTVSLAGSGWTLPAQFLTGATLSTGGLGVADFNAANTMWSSFTGSGVPVTRFYVAASTFSISSNMTEAITAGVKLCITLRPAYNPVSSTDLANMTTMLQALQAAGAVCDITLWHEPYYSGLTSAQYIAMVQYYGPTVRTYYPLVFCTSTGSVYYNNENSYYPGDAWVDKVATDYYCASPSIGWLNLPLAAQPADNAVPPKPFGVWELNGATDPVNGQTQAQVTTYMNYIASYFQGRQAAGQPCADVILFNGGAATGGYGVNWLGNGTNQASGFEGGLANWTQAGNCTIASGTSVGAHSGSDAMVVTATASGTVTQAHCTAANITTQGLPVTVGEEVWVTGWFKAATVARACQVGISWYTSAGASISSSFATSINDTTTGWTQVTFTQAAPATAAYCRAVTQQLSVGGSGEVHAVDDVWISTVAPSNDLTTTVAFAWDYRISLLQAIAAATTGISSTNGTDHTADICLSTAYQVTTGSTSATWSSSGSQDLAGIIGGVLISATAPTRASPQWPVTVAEIALNAGPSTPADQLTWTPVTARALQLQAVTQGAQYNLAALTSGTGTVVLDNPDGELIPPGSGTFAGIDSGTPFRVRQILPAATTPYGVPFSGYILNWSQGWPDPMYRGQATVTITDAWAYVNGNLQPILLQEILNDNPYAYWPCIDAAGSAQASNYGSGNGTPLVIQQAKNGSVGVANAFGGNSSALLGAQGTYLLTSSVRTQTQAGMWGLTGTSNGSPPEGYSLTAADTGLPPISGGVTIELFFQTASPYSAVGQSVWMIGGVAQPILQIYMYNNGAGGTLGYQYTGSSGGINTIQGASSVNYCNGQMVHLAFSFNQTSWTSYIDGVQAGSGSFSPSLPAHFDTLTVNGICGTTSPKGAFSVFDSMNFNGYAGHVAVFAGELTPERIMSHYQAGVLGMAGDTPDARIERLLQAGNYPGRRVILQEPAAYAPPCASCQDIASQPAATSITNIAQSTVPAVLAVAPTGDITYLDRSYTWNQTPRWTLDNGSGGSGIPFLPTFAAGYDPLRVVNDVQITQLDNQDIVTPQPPVSTLDATSQAQYGDQSWWVTGYLENDLLSTYGAGPGLIELANWIGNVNAKPGLRVTVVTVEAATNTLGWPLFMTAAKGDMVTVNARPVTDPGLVLTITGRISQTTRNLQWSQDGCAGSIDLLIDIAPEEAVLTADDPVRGQLTGAYPLAW